MIGILDPTFLFVRCETDIVSEVNLILRSCQQFNIELAPLTEYWPDLWSDFGSKLERLLSPKGKRALQALRQFAPKTDARIKALSPNAGTAWRRGFLDLFDSPYLESAWSERMALAVIRAISSGEETIVLCRRIAGRNLVVHRSGNCTLHENKRWFLYVQPSGIGPRRVLCVHHPRNLVERWTARFDWRLPTSGDGSRYPFVVPPCWEMGSTVAFRTISSKPAWVDAHGNGWARPNTNNGAGNHWDVFIQDQQAIRDIGVDQINVVEYGSPEGQPGHLHHIPSEKQSIVRDRGWSR